MLFSKLYKENGRTVVDFENETFKDVLKNNTNNLEEIHPFIWRGDDYNSVQKNSTVLINYEFKFVTK